MNPVAWVPRQVDGPAGDMLSRSDVAKLFGVSEATIRRLIEAGEFPAPLVIGKQGKVWDWESVAYYRLRLKLGERIRLQPVTTGDNDPPNADK